MCLGLVILPGYLAPEYQRDLVRWCLSEHARPPNITNLDAHYVVPEEGIWSIFCRTASVSGKSTIPIKRRSSTKADADDHKNEAEPPDPPQSRHSELKDKIDDGDRPVSVSALTADVTHATAFELLPKLRWANIGWFYNWGTKQYDFDLGRIDVEEPVRSICKEIVQFIDWSEVFERQNSLSSGRQSNTETDDSWKDWETTYGEMRHCGRWRRHN